MSKKIFLLIPVLFTILLADRGLIPFNPAVSIFEPNQRAMIAWNGREEILLLSTDLHSSDSTMVLEVLPLPSEPAVKKGDLETFRRAVKLINSRISILGKGVRFDSEDKIPPPAEVTFHEKIGAHDISVVHLLATQNFVDWVRDYLKSLGFDREVISDAHRDLIESYIAKNFAWFVFDIVTTGKEEKTLEPIQYRFKTNKLFYPLKIASLGSGNTTVELLILTPRLLSRFSGIPINRIILAHEPIIITRDDLKTIDEDMFDLLKEFNEMKLRIWKIEGRLNSFDNDIIAD
jgi:hypothetical protein